MNQKVHVLKKIPLLLNTELHLEGESGKGIFFSSEGKVLIRSGEFFT